MPRLSSAVTVLLTLVVACGTAAADVAEPPPSSSTTIAETTTSITTTTSVATTSVPTTTTKAPPTSTATTTTTSTTVPATTTTIAAPKTFVVSMGDNFYDPMNRTINVGDTVRWDNGGLVQHTSTSPANWDSGVVSPGGSYQVTFDQSGTFNYLCTIHPGQTGTIVVQSG